MNVAGEAAEAYAAFAAGRYREAEYRITKVLQQAPEYPGALTLLGRLSLVEGDPARARRYFEDVVRRHPRVPAVWLDLALALRALGLAREAANAAHKATRFDDANTSAWMILGEARLAMNQPLKASRAFRRALVLSPDNGAAFRGLVRSEGPNLSDALLERMVDSASSPARSARSAAELHYGLAHAYRQRGRRDLFVHHLLLANAKQRTLCADGSDAYDRIFDRLERIFTADAVAGCARAQPVTPTPIFVLGMPRSGTTLVEQLLASHPLVSAGGELDYVRGALRRDWSRRLDRDLPEGFGKLSSETLTSLAQDFARRLALVDGDARFVVDKTPGNYHVLPLLRALFPAGKIVHMTRDPMDTCFSILQHPFDDRSPHTCDQALLAHVYGRYARLMNHWRELTGDGFLTISYEELVASPTDQGRRLFDYCELEWDDRYLDFHRRDDVVRTFSAGQVRHPIYQTSVGAWRPFAAELTALCQGLERILDVAIDSSGVRL
jgi:tetratricopeptide (TPR) repeat protein